MALRRNTKLELIENGEFDGSLVVYDDTYQNNQTYSPLFKSYMLSILEMLKLQFPKGSSLVEVGCGKGDFIELLLEDGYFSPVGFDAAYEGNNDKIQKRYLIEGDTFSADVIVLRHVLEHIQAPHRFLNVLKNIFGNAAIYIEVPNYDWIVEQQAFFDITYEHVNYFSLNALANLFDSGSVKQGVLFNGQYQYVISEIKNLSKDFEYFYDSDVWEALDFKKLFPKLISKISEIERAASEKRSVYIWGAATKGCMFLVHCVHQNRLFKKIEFAIDINPSKWNKYLPGSLVPIRPKSELFKKAKLNDLLIVANPNYKAEIWDELEKNGLGKLEIICL